MLRETETLKVGSQAPAFTLPAANSEGSFSFVDLLSRGALIVEFLRGTW
jgi:peroxiredoxin